MKIKTFFRQAASIGMVLFAYFVLPFDVQGEAPFAELIPSFNPRYSFLLALPDIQKEIQITKSQSVELSVILTKFQDEHRRHTEAIIQKKKETEKDSNIPNNLANLDTREFDQRNSNNILKLLQPNQRERFMEIYLRIRVESDTASALLLKIVSERLNLSDTQIEEIKKIQTQALADKVLSVGEGKKTVNGIKETSIESIRELKKAVLILHEKQQIIIKESSTKALKVLNEEQKSTLEKMQGPALKRFIEKAE
jgi:hypothetical protein